MSRSMTGIDLAEGDRIQLIRMDSDPDPIPAGTNGTVESINRLFWGQHQVHVDWDNGRTLMLVLPHDKYRLLPEPKPNIDMQIGDRIEITSISHRHSPEVQTGMKGTVFDMGVLIGGFEFCIECDDGKRWIFLSPDDKYRLLERS